MLIGQFQRKQLELPIGKLKQIHYNARRVLSIIMHHRCLSKVELFLGI